jgi:hypothetical protein
MESPFRRSRHPGRRVLRRMCHGGGSPPKRVARECNIKKGADYGKFPLLPGPAESYDRMKPRVTNNRLATRYHFVIRRLTFRAHFFDIIRTHHA